MKQDFNSLFFDFINRFPFMTHKPNKSQGWKRSNKLKFFDRFSKQTMKNAILVFIALCITGTIGVLGIFAYVSRDLPDPNTLTERTINQSTKIYDRTGEHLLYEIFGEENRTLVKMQEGFCEENPDMDLQADGIPKYALQATIAAEDRKFCDHPGFDIQGIGRAVIENLKGNRVGGSTLTQQLVKNAILTNEKTITRKAKELILSIELERRYTKDEILQIYFNEIPYGSTYYGIQAASQNYFKKPVDELSMAEAATLAALPKAPTRYLNNPDLLRERRDWILSGMHDLGYISEEEMNTAMEEETDVEVNITNIDAPHFVFHVKQQLEETYGRRQVETGGLKVITSLDYDKQKIAEEVVAENVKERGESLGFSNASLVAIDPKTGQVLSMVGSKDYFAEDIDGQVNVATRLRQPGSSFKPIVYTRAFEMGYTPNTVLWDVKTNFPTSTGNYSPNNYDLSERGPIRLRKALQGSLNIPAVKLLYLVGVDNAINFAEELGYTSFTDRSNFGLAIVLGGAEVQLLEHVNAYAAMANEGKRHDTVSVLRVEGPDGNVLDEWEQQEGKQVINKNAALTISDVLSDNQARAYAFGLNTAMNLGNRPAAAKTGTTNDYRDAWTIGYTPSLVAGVWGGNNDNTEMNRGSGGGRVAGPIWNDFMTRVLEGEDVERFTQPTIKNTGKDMLDGNLKSETVTIDKASGKLATEYTPPSYRVEKTFAEYHNILHYVNRAEPQGPPPENPENDPYYQPWEEGVQTWIKAKEEEKGVTITNNEPPTETDDVHVPENFPRIQIESPMSDAEISGRTINVDVNAEAPRGISRVEYYIDGFFIGSQNAPGIDLNTELPNTIDAGFHTLKAVAYDDVDNSGSDTVGINVNDGVASNGISIVDPRNGQTIQKSQDSFNVVLSLENPERFRAITLFAEPIGEGQRYIVGSEIDPTNPFLTFEWQLPQAGDWVLSATGQDADTGERVNTAGSVVTIRDMQNMETEDEEEGGDETNEDTPENELGDLDPFANAQPAPDEGETTTDTNEGDTETTDGGSEEPETTEENPTEDAE
jgi:1A family penicillin-binding protein